MGNNKHKNCFRKLLSPVCTLLFIISLPIGAQSIDSHTVNIDTGAIKREPWILQQSTGLYTVQVSAFNNETSAMDFITENNLQNDVALFRANSGGEVWYKAIYGTFEKRRVAVQAKEELAQRIPEQAPWLRRFSEIQQEIRGIVDTAVGNSLDNQVAGELKRGQSAFNQQNYVQALEVWTPLAVQGSAEAQYGLGFMYESGWGIKRDYVKAFAWYERAATLGHAKSQYNLGLLYLNGFGVAKDTDKGRYWVQAAAGQKDRRALEFLQNSSIQIGQ